MEVLRTRIALAIVRVARTALAIQRFAVWSNTCPAAAAGSGTKVSCVGDTAMELEDRHKRTLSQTSSLVRPEGPPSWAAAGTGGRAVPLRCTPNANVGRLVYDQVPIAEHPQLHKAFTGTCRSSAIDYPDMRSVTHLVSQLDPSDRVTDDSDLTHVKFAPLGSVPVVADTYAGPMQPNAIRESDYRRMVRIIERIDSGESSLQFDLSGFLGEEGGLTTDGMAFANAAAEAAKFKQQYIGYLRELVKTPAGLQLLTRLDSSIHKTTIKHSTSRNEIDPKNNDAGHLSAEGVPGPGTDVTVFAAPHLTNWTGETCVRGQQPWMKDRPRFAFYHELVHAYYFNRGESALHGHSHAQCVRHYPHRIAKEEFQAVGLGPYAANAVSENAIRAQMGVPRRPTYSGASWDGPDIWGYPEDGERLGPSR